MVIDVSFLLVLILLNGLFAMSEIAVVSSRRARLMQMADEGRTGATRALALAAQPTRFLSSVQVGITTIGVLSGAIGEAAIASRLRVAMDGVPSLAPYAGSLSLVLMVLIVTYVSLILGELAPKRLALTQPEAIATVVARPMDLLARAARPVIVILSFSTDTILRVFGVRQAPRPSVTVEELRVLLEQGTEEGVLEPSEHEMMTNVLNLDERRVHGVLTPRSEVVYLDVQSSTEANLARLREDPHAVLPLCDGGLDNVLGVVRATGVLRQLLEGHMAVEFASLAEPALFVPETMSLMKLLEQFRRTHLPLALVVDEFGDVQGLVSLSDVTASIVGDQPTEPGEAPDIVQRADGSWLLDGGLDIEAVVRTLGIDAAALDAGERQHYHTLGGLAMVALGQVPRTGDVFERAGYRFEIVDMDGNRVDRVLASRIVPPPDVVSDGGTDAAPGS